MHKTLKIMYNVRLCLMLGYVYKIRSCIPFFLYNHFFGSFVIFFNKYFRKFPGGVRLQFPLHINVVM